MTRYRGWKGTFNNDDNPLIWNLNAENSIASGQVGISKRCTKYELKLYY